VRPSAEALNWVHLKRNRSEIWIAALLDGGETASMRWWWPCAGAPARPSRR